MMIVTPEDGMQVIAIQKIQPLSSKVQQPETEFKEKI
jgi:hypothetical protein